MARSIRQKAQPEFDNPLGVDQRNLLIVLARYTKESELLEGRDRKLLFQAGRFRKWFPSNFIRLPEILEELIPDLLEDDGVPKEREVVAVRATILAAAKRDGISKYGEATSRSELMLLQNKYDREDLSPPERLRLAELLEADGDVDAAKRVATALKDEFPENDTVLMLCGRLGV